MASDEGQEYTDDGQGGQKGDLIWHKLSLLFLLVIFDAFKVDDDKDQGDTSDYDDDDCSIHVENVLHKGLPESVSIDLDIPELVNFDFLVETHQELEDCGEEEEEWNSTTRRLA